MNLRKNLLLLAFAVIAFSTGCTKSEDPKTEAAPQLPPVGGQETLPPKAQINLTTYTKLESVIDIGQRAVTWLNLVNKNRDLTTRLNLADRSSKNPVPPESPNVSSVVLILKKFNDRLAALPPEMIPYLIDGEALVETPPVPDDVFIKMIRELNSSYQGTIRWLGQEEWFETYYAEQDVRDIRGYYFFMKEPTAVTELESFDDLQADKKAKYTDWLVGMCHNAKIEKTDCEAELVNSTVNGSATNFYKKYLPIAKSTYDYYFTVSKDRTDLIWNKDKTQLTQDFVTPSLQKIADWLKTNVEEEWKALGFNLLINFIPENNIAPYVVFKKGVTPNVSGPTGNIITMDPDYSLDDYNTQWTIRHEFGHVLGFPDCYLEFYDKKNAEMIYYTIEPDNLMCAWGGKLKQSHIDELLRVY